MITVEERLNTFNAFGMATIENQKVIVYLSAQLPDQERLDCPRVVAESSKLDKDLRWAGILALNIRQDDEDIDCRELAVILSAEERETVDLVIREAAMGIRKMLVKIM